MDEKQLKYNKQNKMGLLGDVANYMDQYPKEIDSQKVLKFLQQESNLFGRDSKRGHITCSSWVLNYERTHAVLVYHRRLRRWIQPGGHVEPFEMPRQGALREAGEESGISGLRLLDQRVFHISIMNFPKGKDGPSHLHLDLRFLIQAPKGAKLSAPEEVGGAKWVPLNQLENYSEEETILMMAEKTANWLLLNKEAGRGQL